MVRLPVSAGAIREAPDARSRRRGRASTSLRSAARASSRLVLRQQFLRGRAEPGAVRLGGPEGAARLPARPRGRAARRRRRACCGGRAARAVPVIVVAVGFAEDTTIPYVLATDVVRVGAGEAFPLEPIARAIAVRLGEHGAPLAARVPLLREAVSAAARRVVRAKERPRSRAAAWLPGADLPVLALNELRLVLRLAQAYGAAGEIASVCRSSRRPSAPASGCAPSRASCSISCRARAGRVEAVVAYAGTRALGEAARACAFALAPTPRPGGAARA